jgi:hypothetical protein
MYVNLNQSIINKSIILSKNDLKEKWNSLHIYIYIYIYIYTRHTNLLPLLSSTEVARNIPEIITEQKHEEPTRPHHLTHYFSKLNADRGIYKDEISETGWIVVSVKQAIWANFVVEILPKHTLTFNLKNHGHIPAFLSKSVHLII